MNFLKRLHIRYVLHRHAIPHPLWLAVMEVLPAMHGMTAVEKAHLRELSTLFLHQKNLMGVQGLELTAEMRLTIAAQACLPVLRLGMECLHGWSDVIVYPGAFRVNRDAVDAAGVVQQQQRVLSGEAWSRGPIVLSWADIAQDSLSGQPGHNVVIHEIAHKLDMLNGSCNGYPPLHHEMSVPLWTEVWTKAFNDLQLELEQQQYSVINPYAATDPAEFFAVLSEYFFTAPALLAHRFTEVYQQLKLYYRQDPLAIMARN